MAISSLGFLSVEFWFCPVDAAHGGQEWKLHFVPGRCVDGAICRRETGPPIGSQLHESSMQYLLICLWRDEAGFVHSSESVLMGTILTIGSIAGLVTVRDTVATEFGDLATALLDMDHSYSYAAIETDCGAVAGSFYVDELDFCAPGFSDDDPPTRLNPVVPGIPPSGGEGN